MTETQICGVVLPLELAQKARVVAAMKGKSRSRLIRDLLEIYLRGFDTMKTNNHQDESPQKENEEALDG